MSTVAIPEAAGTGTCERCRTDDVQRFKYSYEVPSAWYSGTRREGHRTLVLTENLCAECHKKALDKDADKV